MYTIDAESFTENTRNDSYIIIEKSKKTGVLISYAKYLCRDINKVFSLNLNYSEDDLKSYANFKRFVDELDKNGYYIFQLTRL